jgi:hypothetical protein
VILAGLCLLLLLTGLLIILILPFFLVALAPVVIAVHLVRRNSGELTDGF